MMGRLGLCAPLLLAMAACATHPQSAASTHPEAALFDPAIDANAAVDAGLAQARNEGKLALIAMGGNWCHDSRAFAGWMQSDRFASLLADNFVLVYVNVGLPQTGDGFNLDIARRFGIDKIEGTPTVLVIDGQGQVLNAQTAQDWRNTASRTPEAIHAELSSFLMPAPPA